MKKPDAIYDTPNSRKERVIRDMQALWDNLARSMPGAGVNIEKICGYTRDDIRNTIEMVAAGAEKPAPQSKDFNDIVKQCTISVAEVVTLKPRMPHYGKVKGAVDYYTKKRGHKVSLEIEDHQKPVPQSPPSNIDRFMLWMRENGIDFEYNSRLPGIEYAESPESIVTSNSIAVSKAVKDFDFCIFDTRGGVRLIERSRI
jgi:hypothetical protein